jgi:hypothetical protein
MAIQATISMERCLFGRSECKAAQDGQTGVSNHVGYTYYSRSYTTDIPVSGLIARLSQERRQLPSVSSSTTYCNALSKTKKGSLRNDVKAIAIDSMPLRHF